MTDADTEQPVTMARATGAELLRSLRTEADKVAGIAERLREAIATVGDPTAAEVELEAMRTVRGRDDCGSPAAGRRGDGGGGRRRAGGRR